MESLISARPAKRKLPDGVLSFVRAQNGGAKPSAFGGVVVRALKVHDGLAGSVQSLPDPEAPPEVRPAPRGGTAAVKQSAA